jgi:hypothetical protein
MNYRDPKSVPQSTESQYPKAPLTCARSRDSSVLSSYPIGEMTVNFKFIDYVWPESGVVSVRGSRGCGYLAVACILDRRAPLCKKARGSLVLSMIQAPTRTPGGSRDGLFEQG